MARESPQSPHPKFNMRVAAYVNVSALGCTQTRKFAKAHRSPPQPHRAAKQLVIL